MTDDTKDGLVAVGVGALFMVACILFAFAVAFAAVWLKGGAS